MNSKFWLKTILLSVALLLGMSVLPYNDYIKYQSIKTGVYSKSKWLYERASFDDTPVDVAFFGTSHTLVGINSDVIQKGVSDSLGQPINVVNYAIPQLGRDMHYTLLKMLLDNKTPDLVILEIRESEARDLHPGTHYLANIHDLLIAPKIVNLRYFDNLYRQPGRNLKLGLITLWPELFSYQKNFSNSHYRGKHYFTNSEMIENTGSAKVRTRDWLEHQRSMKNTSAPYKYNEVSPLESYLYFNANNTYLNKIEELLAAKGVDLIFLYLPDYKTSNLPLRDIYSDKAEVVNLGFEFYARDDVWSDLVHLNKAGSDHATSVMQNEVIRFYKEKNNN